MILSTSKPAYNDWHAMNKHVFASSPHEAAFLARARLWLVLATAAALLAHAFFNVNMATWIGLANCHAFAWVQYVALQKKLPISLQFLTVLNTPTPPRWLAFTPTVAGCIAVGLVIFQYKTILGKEAGLACLTILASFKLWECRTPRDVQVWAGLLFFLLLGIFLREESVLALITVIICAVLTLSAWVFFNAGFAASSDNTAHSHPWQAPLKETLRLALVGLPLAVLLFFVFPRITGPLWGLPQDAESARIGLSNTLEPGRFAQLATSEALALRAKFEGVPPPATALYWRGPVLSQFDGLVWRQIESKQGVRLNPEVVSIGQSHRYTLVAEPHKRTLRVLLDVPVAVEPSSGMTLTAQASPVGEPMLERETVSAVSASSLQWGGGRETHTPQTSLERIALQNELDLPAGNNPRIFAYAADLRRTLGVNQTDPTPFINAVLKHYQASFIYTLQPPTPLGRKEDAVDGFFFDTQAGYCEHFAASFVVVMRALDFAARIVTGYQGGELNTQDGWLTVRQSDAHAWAEVLHPTLGWQRVDPTAAVAPWRVQNGGSALQSTAGKQPTGLEGLSQISRQALLPVRQWAEATVRVWQDYGLNYGKDRQKQLFKKLGFPAVDTASITAILGGAVTLWLLTAAWVYRDRKRACSTHTQALAAFDALCKNMPQNMLQNLSPKVGKKAPHKTPLPPPRLPAQTPRDWLNMHAQAISGQQLLRLQAGVQTYEKQVFAAKNGP